MILNLQDFVPYLDSLKWHIQDAFYQSEGANAWLSSDVPFDITSNYRAAYQNAKVIIESLKISSHKGTIHILETGAGVGMFALSFLRAFQDICEADGLNYMNYLHYMVSDYSQQAIEEMSKNIYFENLQKAGILDFYVLDAMNPESIRYLNGEPFEFKTSMLTAIIGNYQHDVLPVIPLKIENNQILAKQLKIRYWLLPTATLTPEKLKNALSQFKLPEEIEADDEDIQQVIKYSLKSMTDYLYDGLNNNKETKYEKIDIQPWLESIVVKETCLQFFNQESVNEAELIETIVTPIKDFVADLLKEHLLKTLFTISRKVISSYLEEEVQYLPIEKETMIPDPLERQVIEEFNQKHEITYNLYPCGSFQSIRKFWPLLKAGGLILISDKGVFHPKDLNKTEFSEPSTHGNSMAHMVNFPLLRDYATLLGGSSLQNAKREGFLYTIAISKSNKFPSKLKHVFNLLFGHRNINNLLGFVNYSARTHMIQGQCKDAARLFSKMLEYRPGDVDTIYYAATCYFQLGQLDKAMRYLSMDYYDYFKRFDYNWLRGKIYYQQKDFANALNCFQVSNYNFPRKVDSLMMIGKSWNQLNSPQRAYHACQSVLKIDSRHTEALTLAAQIKEQVIQDLKIENSELHTELLKPESVSLATAETQSEE